MGGRDEMAQTGEAREDRRSYEKPGVGREWLRNVGTDGRRARERVMVVDRPAHFPVPVIPRGARRRVSEISVRRDPSIASVSVTGKPDAPRLLPSEWRSYVSKSTQSASRWPRRGIEPPWSRRARRRTGPRRHYERRASKPNIGCMRLHHGRQVDIYRVAGRRRSHAGTVTVRTGMPTARDQRRTGSAGRTHRI